MRGDFTWLWRVLAAMACSLALAAITWAASIEVRTTSLDLHRQYIAKALDRIECRLDSIDQKIDNIRKELLLP
jgi:phage shock protein A